MIEYHKIKDRKTGKIGVIALNHISLQVGFYGDEIIWDRLMESHGEDILRHQITKKEYLEFAKRRLSEVAV